MEIVKVGRRNSKKDLETMQKVMAQMQDLMTMMHELMGVEETDTEDAEPAEKKDFDPNTGGGVDRDKLKASDFVFGDTRSFPIVTAQDVKDAVSSWGRYKGTHSFDEFKKRLTALARRKGFSASLPTEWKTEKALEKQLSLDEKLCMIRHEFEELYQPSENSMMVYPDVFLYAYEIYDTYLIACLHFEDKRKFYQVNYQQDAAGEFVFDDYTKWQEVEQVWQPIQREQAVIAIGKTADEKQLVYGVVTKPEPFVDSQGDVMTKEEVEAMAHGFMEESRLYDLLHKDNLPASAVVPVESYIAPQDLTWGSKTIPAGSWIVVSHVKDTDIWNKIKKGDINAYSIKGIGYRKEVK